MTALQNIYWRKIGVIGLLRLFTGVAQFTVIILVTSALTLQDVGSYTLFTIYLNYTAQFAGFSFYTYFVRTISTISPKELGPTLYQIWIALFFTVGSTIFCMCILVWTGLLHISNIFLFFLLVILTVFNTQHENFLVAVRAPVIAAFLLLLRSCWVYVALVIHYLGFFDLSLEFVYQLWIASEAVAAIMILIYLRAERMLPTTVHPIDIAWIKRGLCSSLKYTVLGFLLILTVSSQRVFLSPYGGEQYVGIFHFFYVVSVFGPNLVEATIYAVLLPRIIRATSEAGHVFLPPSFRIMGFMLAINVVGLGLLYLILPYAFGFLGKVELATHFEVIRATICFALLYTASRGFHYQLYAAGADNWILGTYTLSALAGCGTSYLLIPKYGLTGASVSLVFTGMTMLVALCLPFVMRLNLSLTGRTTSR
ncbi:lipopolysaccharide biosynthesis protein [Shinella sumterensis]|uniref:O-antigen/teichoic acid export membrane protein n=1 Tax=Shinella sumterensis TaxID=1967501 RepID=A0AA50H6N0_9HYPH|nr:hypothetical protein [Shinella sumterensis]WLR96181.1 hypothetical protein Q9313_10605 [Shinella sumterensis]